LKLPLSRNGLLTAALLAILTITAATQNGTKPTRVCPDCIRHNLEYLAGPELHGRGSGTEDEHRAAQYIAEQLKSYGLKPAAENGEYIQTANISTRNVTGTPALTFNRVTGGSAQQVSFSQGKEFALVTAPAEPDVSAPLQKLDLNDASASPASVKSGAALLMKLRPDSGTVEKVIGSYMQSKAAILILPMDANDGIFRQILHRGPRARRRLGNEATGPNLVLITNDAAEQMWSLADGATIKLHADLTPWETTRTWNVLGKIEGRNLRQLILLSAHLDHLGVRDGKTYPGADDDGSGTVAVMELARALANQPQPQRTLVFALWGSEEVGLIGARYFLQNPTFDLKDVVANLEFEMIARADPKVKPNELWLTGWDRSNLGSELAAHGAQLVGDPHPDQSFFTRSDNFALAKKGIIAQTVSSYGLHKDYHQPTDTVDKVDWQHLDSAVGSMIAPISWLANSDFVPAWNAGMKP
jgi:hypothetical protein